MNDDGVVTFVDSETEQPLDPAWVSLAKKQAGETIKGLVAGKVGEINAAIEALAALHQHAPAPTAPKYEMVPFDLPDPQQPIPKGVTLLGKLLSSKREAIERENGAALIAWRTEKEKWEALRASHQAREERRRRRAEQEVLTEVAAMEAQLEENIADIAWPRETNVNFEIRADGALCVLDVDLPEIDHMPEFEAVVAGRGFEIKKKELSETKRRKLYMQHVHAVALRIVGEAFATLPRCEKVVLSGYSQRPDPRTGHIRDEYCSASLWIARAGGKSTSQLSRQ